MSQSENAASEDYLERHTDFTSDFQRVKGDDDWVPPSRFEEYEEGAPESEVCVSNEDRVDTYRDDREGLRARRPSGERLRQVEAVGDLVSSGHGFLLRTLGGAPTFLVPTPCRYCGEVIRGAETEWVCQFGWSDWAGCSCNWCLCRQQYESGTYRARGRPAVQCGQPECKRKLRNDQQRARRSKEKVLVRA